MKNSILSICTIALFSVGANAQVVNIPDANFKAYLIGNSAINTNSDTEIQVSEANSYTGSIECNTLGISDLTGIEAFAGITNLSLWNEPIGIIDLSQNTSLIRLDLVNLNITTLDLSQNIALTRVSSSINSNLASIVVSQCLLMDTLLCTDNPILTNIDVSQNSQLKTFWCHTNGLTSIDVSQNLNLVSFYCYNNSLATLDVSQNTNLVQLFCSSNNLTNLDMSNIGTLTTFNANLNPDLICIEVDDVSTATANWTNIDPASSFSEDCVLFLGINSDESIQNVSVYPNPVQSQLTINADEKIESIVIMDLTGEIIKTIVNPINSVDVSNLINGVYFLQLKMANSLLSKKFIKE